MNNEALNKKLANNLMASIAESEEALATGKKIPNVFFGTFPGEPEFLTEEGLKESIATEKAALAKMVEA